MRQPSKTPRPAYIVLALGLLMTFPADVAAQTVEVERFTPLANGGYWEYTLVDRSEGGTPPPAYVSLEVRGDTTVSDQSYALLRVREYDEGKHELRHKVCGIGTDSNGVLYTIDFADPHGWRCITVIPIDIRPLNSFFIFVVSDTSVVISGLTYPVEAIARHPEYVQASGGAYRHFERLYATDLGLYYSWLEEQTHWAAGSMRSHSTYKLTYAEVEGQTYGTSVVSVEDSQPSGTSGLYIASVYPNPAQGTFRVQLREAPSTPMDYTVYDVTGRRVAEGAIPAGSREVTVELGPGAAGVLLLRVSDGQGNSETRRLVRLPH